MAASKKRRTYDDTDKARAIVVLTANGGNKSRTARDLGIPLPTLRTWIREWDKQGGEPPATVTELVPEVKDAFLEKAEKIRTDVLDKIESVIPDATIKNLTPLATTLGILTDKIDKIRGVDVQHHKHEHKHVLPSAEEAASFVSGFLEAAMKQQEQREQDIIDVDVIEEQPLGLLPPVSSQGE